MKNKIKAVSDIKSGYVIELENNKLYLLGRCKDFTKFGKSEDNEFINIDNINSDLEFGNHKIIKVYGLCDTPTFSFVASTTSRELLWEKEIECVWNLDLSFQDILFLTNLNIEVKYLQFSSNSIAGKTVHLLNEDMQKIQMSRLTAYLSDFINAKDGVIYKRD